MNRVDIEHAIRATVPNEFLTLATKQGSRIVS
jgi:hypothetical protein